MNPYNLLDSVRVVKKIEGANVIASKMFMKGTF